MVHPQIDQCVRLKQPVPEAELPQGAIGVVCSTWFAPQTTFEVEFRPPGTGDIVRVLLLDYQFNPEARSAGAVGVA